MENEFKIDQGQDENPLFFKFFLCDATRPHVLRNYELRF